MHPSWVLRNSGSDEHAQAGHARDLNVQVATSLRVQTIYLYFKFKLYCILDKCLSLHIQ